MTEKLDQMEMQQDLTVEKFLRFDSLASDSANAITTKDIEEYISGPEAVQWLNTTQFREHVIKVATQDPRWCTDRLCPILSNHLTLCTETYQRIAPTQEQAELHEDLAEQEQPIVSKISTNMPRQYSDAAKRTPDTQSDVPLLAALTQLANDVVTVIKPMLKEMSERADYSNECKNGKRVFSALLTLMNACLFPSDIYSIWKNLLEEIIADREMLAGLIRNPTPHFTLLRLWSNALPPTVESDALIKPVLHVTWSTLGSFLLLHLEKQHDTWNLIALERLVNSKSSLSATRAQRLAQIAAPEIQALLEQLVQVPVHWPLAINMVEVLSDASYRGSQAYADLLEKFFGDIIQAPQNWELARHLAFALAQSSRLGSKHYRSMISKFLRSLFSTFPLQSVGFEVVEALVKYGYAGKADLVPILLETTLYQHDLARVLPLIYPTDEELATFFVQQGKDYLATQSQVEVMLNLYNRFKSQPNHQERLWVLLDEPLEEVTVVQVLKTIALDGEELIPTLQRYGVLYLQGYQQRPQLAAWVIQTFTDLAARQYPIKDLLFTLFTESADPSHLEILLARSTNQLTLADLRKFLNTYGTNPAYISFCCRSATLLALLEQYAKQLATQAKKDAQQYSQEKMHMLALWLEPQRVSEMALSYDEIEAILTSAHLQVPEQVQFLVHYGNHYLRDTEHLPHVQEYIRNYIVSLTADSFDQPEQYALFKAVSLDTSLDTETRSRRLCWQHVLGFFAHPATDTQTLTNLGEALSCLPIDEAMGNKLAQASVLCIQEESDLAALVHTIQQIPDFPYVKMMYCIAQNAAVMYNQRREERSLIPYIVFVLASDLVEPERFVSPFLDALLHPIADSDIDTWARLHSLIETYQVQPLSPQALARWYLYLDKHGLLNKVQQAAQKFLGLTDSTDQHPIAAGNSGEEAAQENGTGNSGEEAAQENGTGSSGEEAAQENGRGALWKKLWQRKKPI